MYVSTGIQTGLAMQGGGRFDIRTANQGGKKLAW